MKAYSTHTKPIKLSTHNLATTLYGEINNVDFWVRNSDTPPLQASELLTAEKVECSSIRPTIPKNWLWLKIQLLWDTPKVMLLITSMLPI